ncbi:hypothetical protein O6H91_02G035400 [Diphasiastrum complanatum]|uniref:Uncharacterized protein n=1 Tax=Diphasiastrum complanatum TaxID=34168 RepID=A0ACC2EEQ3_DIPCM|nr:hypothetical protein O6H91_Y472100 [Diphasiastrum complanatum]KAJ7564827.1 hypothetical protein O6H91_02G035400 [Diphasiastrum complanatum]
MVARAMSAFHIRPSWPSSSLLRPGCRWRAMTCRYSTSNATATLTRSSSSSDYCGAHEGQEMQAMARRHALACIVAAGVAGFCSSQEVVSVAAREVEVGAYLPPAAPGSEFVQFKATSKDTPALRAGNVQPYEFILPPTWKQVRIANILSGNYCQPKCAEPWVEVKFEDTKQGSIQVIASPMVRLTNKPNSKIEEIGNPEKLISALGPFVTGNSYDPDEVTRTAVLERDGQKFYNYELETPFAKTGTHNLAAATAKGNVVLLLVVSANDIQWSNSEKILRNILNSFKV